MTTIDRKPCFLAEAWLTMREDIQREEFSKNSEKEFLEELDQRTMDKVRDIARRYPRLATWELFARTDVGISLLKNVATQTTDFVWEISRTVGSLTVSYSRVPPDTTIASQFIPTLKTKRSRVSTKPVVTDSNKQPVTKTSASIRPLNAATTLKQRGLYRPEPRYYLQHVRIPSTLMISLRYLHILMGVVHVPRPWPSSMTVPLLCFIADATNALEFGTEHLKLSTSLD
jgi:hypothetical protein